MKYIGWGLLVGVLLYAGYMWIYPIFKKIYKLFAKRKEIEDAKEFLLQLDREFPIADADLKTKEERSKKLVESGFDKDVISQAQQENAKAKRLLETPLYKAKQWIEQAQQQGLTEQEAVNKLVEKNWNKKLINKALKLIKKQNLQNGRQQERSQKTPRLPELEGGESEQIQSGAKEDRDREGKATTNESRGFEDATGARGISGEDEGLRNLPSGVVESAPRDSGSVAEEQPSAERKKQYFS